MTHQQIASLDPFQNALPCFCWRLGMLDMQIETWDALCRRYLEMQRAEDLDLWGDSDTSREMHENRGFKP